MNFYGVLHKILLPQKFEGGNTVTNILVPEITNPEIVQSQEVAQMISKLIELIAIIQQYQNERLKTYSAVMDMLFISFTKDSNLQKRGIRIHTISNSYQFDYNVKLIQTILKHSYCTR